MDTDKIIGVNHYLIKLGNEDYIRVLLLSHNQARENKQNTNERDMSLCRCVPLYVSKWCTCMFVAQVSKDTHRHTHTYTQNKNTHRYTLDTVTSRSTSTDKTDHSIHLWVSALSAPFICGWVDQADQHFSHHWPMMHLGLWRNVTGLNALICHRGLAAGHQWQTHTYAGFQRP